MRSAIDDRWKTKKESCVMSAVNRSIREDS
jgi:hypothetical protein